MVLPSELPFYSEEESVEYTLVKEEAGPLEQGVRSAREGLGGAVAQAGQAGGLVQGQLDQLRHVLDTGKAHSQGAYNQLLEEDNLPARVGVIAGAAAAGLLLGLRGRMVKRVVYMGLGAGLGATVCYPGEAREARAVVEAEGRQLVAAARGLVSGAKGLDTVSSPMDMSLIASGMRVSLLALGRLANNAWQLAAQQAATLQQKVVALQQPSPAAIEDGSQRISVGTQPETEVSARGSE